MVRLAMMRRQQKLSVGSGPPELYASASTSADNIVEISLDMNALAFHNVAVPPAPPAPPPGPPPGMSLSLIHI